MSKVLVLLAAAPLAACSTDTPPTPLAQLSGTSVDLTTTNEAKLIQPGFTAYTTLTIAGPEGDCIKLGDDVTADLDGVHMEVDSRGGPWSNWGDSGCELPSFRLPEPTAANGTSTLLIRDSATTWTITGVDLFTNDFALVDAPIAGEHARVVWQSASTIANGAYGQFEQNGNVMFNDVFNAAGNTIDIALPAGVTGAGTLSINAARSVPATRCEGPATCTLYITAGADLSTTIASAPVKPQDAPDVVRR
ncbi:MAG: hypothetical protein JO257_20310 [Deltaproteobacteria bacterium]|nr:hypothetical protein [Deltaproteobacteria bacterium]